jgi:hypothetical protein
MKDRGHIAARELAARFTDTQKYFVSEASVVALMATDTGNQTSRMSGASGPPVFGRKVSHSAPDIPHL